MRFFIILFSIYILNSCTSAKVYNERLHKPVSAEHLRNDADYALKNLQDLHPELYWYISKEQLEAKFDSLKTSLTTPLTPVAFYDRLAPVITQIREGHLQLTPPLEKWTRSERKKIENQKGLFSRMNYVIDQNRVFVKDNTDKFEGIKVGTEILEVAGTPMQKFLEKYGRYVTGDGKNTTFKKYGLAQRWAMYFTAEYGILDSVNIKTRYQNEIRSLYIHRETITKEEKKEEKKVIASINKNETKKTKDYNPVTRSFNRDLQFLEKDSSVAYMKIKTFSGYRSARFYKESFRQLKKTGTRFLIIDVRDNFGGSLREINNLYSYLTPEKFCFIEDIGITKRTSVLHADYFSEFPAWLYPALAVGYPFYGLITLLSAKKKGDQFYLRNNNWFSIKNPKKEHFTGKVYLLINGSSFSAAAILASKLKNDKRATLVGEETGGANDGTVAGRYATIKLPYSRLSLPIGLMLIKPDIIPTHTQKGVVPDMEILPTLNDILGKKDPQLQWIKSDIEPSL